MTDLPPSDGSPNSSDPNPPADGFDQQDELMQAIERADRAERALARAQGSFTMTVGQLVIDAGQSPRQLLALPFTLLRMRRSRRAMRAQRRPGESESAPLTPRDVTLLGNPTRVLLPRRTVTTDTRPSIVMIAPPQVVDAWRADAHVSVALPHDATALARAIDPDAFVVHTQAGAPGSPWHPLGEPGEAARERILVAVRETCGQLGRPLVLLHDPVHAPGLDPFASTCDLVLDMTVDDVAPASVLARIRALDAAAPQISSASRLKSATNRTSDRESADLSREADEIGGER